MRKKSTLFLAIFLSVFLNGCGNQSEKEGSGTSNSTTTSSSVEKSNGVSQNEKTENSSSVSTRKISVAELDKLVSDLDFKVISTEHVKQSDNDSDKDLYPDALQAVVRNDTKDEIKSAELVLVGWDSNDQPVKIREFISPRNNSYLLSCSLGSMNLIPGTTFGENMGMEIDKNCHIAKFKAYAMSYETFDGNKWENPYKQVIEKMYESGIKYSEDYSIEIDSSIIKNN